jgi:hypothetical protein
VDDGRRGRGIPVLSLTSADIVWTDGVHVGGNHGQAGEQKDEHRIAKLDEQPPPYVRRRRTSHSQKGSIRSVSGIGHAEWLKSPKASTITRKYPRGMVLESIFPESRIVESIASTASSCERVVMTVGTIFFRAQLSIIF